MDDEVLITGGYVVTMDDDLGDVPGGDVRILNGVITEIGTGLRPGSPDTEIVDARGRIVMPGMIDTHRHTWQGAIAAYTPQITGYGYGPVVLSGITLDHTAEDVYAGTLWGALQALDAGITSIGDWAHALRSAEHADGNLRGLKESGIRGVFFCGGPGPATDDPNPPHPVDARRMRDENFPGNGMNGRLRMGMWLRGPAFTSAERNREDFAFARELGLPISVHVGMAGTADAIPVLQSDELLGDDINYVHCNMLTDEEFDLVRSSGGTITLTPSTDMLMQFGTYPATGPTLETLARNEMVHEVELNQRDMLRLATIGGALVLGIADETGSLTPGKQGDVVLVDMRSPHLDGYGDPVAMLGLGAGPADVETVLVGGEFLKRDGALVGGHIERARELMHQTQDRLRARVQRRERAALQTH
ncbi:amidohydrolase family protein [Streptomyces sp. J2-1]|uniref:amidohydrolase family protein n=1 Tax=Streptomyces corallincola TaxID=2851888 RepID=UPI001C38EF68|nr:amidohydrolase family protein [Streptomyces corallincola]MBV2357595.1 amidohydrolase family protein [Streptomyces corallincola]